MECGERGHFKCTSEKESQKIKINTHVFDDLDEFFRTDKKTHKGEEDDDIRMSFDYIEDIPDRKHDKNNSKRDKSTSKKLIENTNVLIPGSDSDNDSYGNTMKQKYRDFEDNQGVPRGHREKDIYCCICGERHNET